MNGMYNDVEALKDINIDRLTTIQKEIVLARLAGKAVSDIALERGCSKQNISISLK
jgi:DNA-binding NarL/FixJ family response regulator